MSVNYGSEFHLLRYLGRQRNLLNNRVSAATGLARIEWLDAPADPGKRWGDGEWKGLSFLADNERLQAAWRGVWPSRGNPPNWDAIGLGMGASGPEWLLVEAKANEQELCSSCQASERGGLGKITETLTRTKRALGAADHHDWLNGYYQYANRLSVLHFLREHQIPARLLFIYFVGDESGVGRSCPIDEAGWQASLSRQREHLGLPTTHPLSGRVHSLFLPVQNGPAASVPADAAAAA